MKHLNEESIKKIIELSKTVSQNKIAKMFNKTQGNISILLKKNNIICDNTNINLGKLSINIDYFKEINSNDKAYWLGYICADGYITNNSARLSLISKDLEVIEGFKNAIKSEHTISKINSFDKRTKKTYTSYSIIIGNRLFVRNLVNLGITNMKSDILEFPKIEEKYYSYFIAGLFDGDGSVSFYGKNKNFLRMNLISTNEILTYIKKYLEKINININSLEKISKNKNNVFKIYLYKDTYKFLNYIYNDNNFEYYLKRKYDIYKQYIPK
jgi:hypothetical protein